MVHHILRVFDLYVPHIPTESVPLTHPQLLRVRSLRRRTAGAQPEFRESVFFGEV
jgi:hypothetical protein